MKSTSPNSHTLCTTTVNKPYPYINLKLKSSKMLKGNYLRINPPSIEFEPIANYPILTTKMQS